MPQQQGTRHDSRAPHRRRCKTCALLANTHAAKLEPKWTPAAQHMHAHCSPDSVPAQSQEGRRPHYLCGAGEGQVNFQDPAKMALSSASLTIRSRARLRAAGVQAPSQVTTELIDKLA